MEVQFREFDAFDCWFWLRFPNPPGQGERQYIEELFNSWYYLGRLGSFNAENLQVHEQGADVSWMAYDNESVGGSSNALMHNIGDMEYKDNWARIWCDLGTSDGVGLDALHSLALVAAFIDVVQPTTYMHSSARNTAGCGEAYPTRLWHPLLGDAP